MIKDLFKIFGPILLIFVLSLLVYKVGLGKVLELRKSIATERKNETILQQKLDLLSQVAEDTAQASFSSSALPEKNPALITLSQLKLLAGNSGLLLSNIKAGAAVKGEAGLSSVNVTFDVEGQRSAVIQLLKNISLFAPISKVEKVRLNEVGGILQATVTVKSFFADLPQKLPAISDAIKDLTADDRSILREVLGLTQPLFVDIPPSQVSGKEDPFSP